VGDEVGSGEGEGLGKGPDRDIGPKGKRGDPDSKGENLEGGGDGECKGLEGGGGSPKSDWDGKKAGRGGGRTAGTASEMVGAMRAWTQAA
jgi:hypothetical protein